MKGMEKPTDKETAKYNAVAEIAGLLRVSTIKRLSNSYDVEGNLLDPIVTYHNSVFSTEEHETVKRAFLRLVSEL